MAKNGRGFNHTLASAAFDGVVSITAFLDYIGVITSIGLHFGFDVFGAFYTSMTIDMLNDTFSSCTQLPPPILATTHHRRGQTQSPVQFSLGA